MHWPCLSAIDIGPPWTTLCCPAANLEILLNLMVITFNLFLEMHQIQSLNHRKELAQSKCAAFQQ